MTVLGDLVEDLRSGFACGDSVDNGIVQLRMNNVDTEGSIDLATVRRVPRDATKDIGRFVVVEGDVMFNNTNSPELVGKSAVFRGFSEPVVFSNHFTRIRVRRDRLEPRYLARWLAAEWRTGRFTRMCNQWVNQASVRRDALLTLTLPTPPLAEQRRIADLLDKADAIRRKRKEAIALTEELLRSAFLEMFGDPVTNPKGWPVRSVDDLCESKQYGTAEKANKARDGLPVLRMNNLTYSGEIELTELKWVPLSQKDRAKLDLRDGDVLFNRVNSLELVGKTAVWHHGDGYTFAGYLIRLRFGKDALGDFVSATMNTSSMKRVIMSIAKPSINMANISGSDLARVNVPVPPVALQRTYKDLRRRVYEWRADLHRHGEVGDTLFNALVARAFSGALE